MLQSQNIFSSANLMRLVIIGCLVLPATNTMASSRGGGQKICSRTAWLQSAACKRETQDEHYIQNAICLNISDRDERRDCYGDAWTDAKQAKRECREQLAARRDLCGDLGEERYDPSFEPEDFQTSFDNRNPYLPLAVGNQWVYENEDETVTVEVLDKTKLIEGVTCIVVNDVVEEDDQLVEDTDDWFGQRLDGTIDYCGEEAKDFAFFEGDIPADPELVETDGSFKAGTDGDKSGTLFMGEPTVGAKYRQEWSPNNAEDIAEVLSISYGVGGDSRFDDLVPEDLVDLLCNDDCVVTEDTSPLDPSALEYKFYALGIGFFLEVKPDSGELLQIVECNVDPRCDSLPMLSESEEE